MSELTAALQYLHSTIDWDSSDNGYVSVNLYRDKISYFDGTTINSVTPNSSNPIKRMIENVEEEVCIECLETDYMFRDPFFVSLIKAYVETIIIRYGSEVSISQPMAHAIIKHELTNYTIKCRTLNSEVILTKENYTDFNSEKCIFILSQNDGFTEIQFDQ